jgi:acyl-coenzyme A thioesterase PaaI-like protein
MNTTTAFLKLVGPSPLYAGVTVMRMGARVAALRVDAWQADRNKPVAQLTGHFQIAASLRGPTQ